MARADISMLRAFIAGPVHASEVVPAPSGPVRAGKFRRMVEFDFVYSPNCMKSPLW